MKKENIKKGAEQCFCILDAYFYSHFLTVFIYIVSSGKKISGSQHLKMESPIEYNLCVCVHAVQNLRCLFLQNVACFNILFIFSRVVFEMGIEARMMQCHSEPVDNPKATIVRILA